MTDRDDPRAKPTSRRHEAEQDLRATSDAVRVDAQRLAAVEVEKAMLKAEDPALDRLSDEAAELGERIARETRAEQQLGNELR